MRIARGETEELELYEVLRKVEIPQTALDWLLRRRRVELRKVSHVLEADEETGQLTAQLVDDEGHLLYTNGVDDIAIDNGVKLLMLLPQMRTAFLEAGFVPKIQTTYEKVVIRKRA